MTDILATSMRSTTGTGRGWTLSLGWIGPGQKYIAVYFWLPELTLDSMPESSSLASDLGRTGHGRGLPQRYLSFQVAAHPP